MGSYIYRIEELTYIICMIYNISIKGLSKQICGNILW
jgi:hypothetical protein